MVLRARCRQGSGMGRVQGSVAGAAIATALMCSVASAPASAQTMNDALSSRMQNDPNARLLAEAKELIYDNERNVVTASGNAELHYQGRTLQADRVVYDRNSGRVFAEGNARLTEANGAVITGDRFELTDDFKNGFIDSLRLTQTVKDRSGLVTARFSAPRAERIEGESMVFERGTYTACEPCRENPERPPLWQVKSARIIHNNSEKTIYYENSTLEFAGIPVAYVPYFWSPDPTEKRRTGFLAPHYLSGSAIGTGVGVPFFWNLAPNYDVTITPTFLSRQGVLGNVEWRHRLMTGSYNIRAAGIFQQEGDAFLPAPLGPRDREFRGSLETTGRFHINERWRWGWDIAVLSDKWFLNNYRVRSESIGANYTGLRESISTLYLQGQGDRSWFDMRGYYFRGLTSYDWQKQLPVVLPVIDYNKRIDGPQPLGGEVGIDVNVTNLHRDAASFVQPGRITSLFFPNIGGGVFPLYETCTVFQRGQCLVRGIAGDYTRASATVSWRRTFIDGMGQSWTPFAYLRGDAYGVRPDFTNFQNPMLANFIGGDTAGARFMPAIGLEYRYPFAGALGTWGTQQLEPIAQIIARPNESRIGSLPNEDAQSLVFDDTSLFNWNKFSGYDRIEGGVRANLGLKYSIQGPNGFYADALFGQSYQVAGRNSYAVGDIANVGLNSGLDSNPSDYVGRTIVSPNQNISFMSRARFDKDDFSIRRFEAGLVANLNPIAPITTSLMYARYAAQPELGLNQRREGIVASAGYNLTSRWSINGGVTFDLDRYLPSRDAFASAYASYTAGGSIGTAPVYRRPSPWTPIGSSLRIAYSDECTTFSVSYIHTPAAFNGGTREAGRLFLVQLDLRTLGQVNAKHDLSPQGASEGVAR
jgi:LPS-assembly protein